MAGPLKGRSKENYGGEENCEATLVRLFIRVHVFRYRSSRRLDVTFVKLTRWSI